jgi:integrase
MENITETSSRANDDDLPSNLEIDAQEAAEFEVDAIHNAVNGTVVEPSHRGLIGKLETDHSLCFKISDYSAYGDAPWVLHQRPHTKAMVVNFNSRMEGGNDLKRMLVYHLIPQFNPSGRLKSFNSTVTYAHGFTYLENYLFESNGLVATAECIRVISTFLINGALDRVRDQASPRQYTLLYAIILLWINLSEQKLIPVQYRLDTPLRLVDTRERQRDLQNRIATTAEGWRPFSQEELAVLVEHALFWSTRALPALLEIQNFLVKIGVAAQNHHQVLKSTRDPALESALSIEVDGVPVCGYYATNRVQKVKGFGGKILEYKYWKYTWLRQMLVSVDKVRDAILILVALITGLRNSELGALSFDDVVEGGDGNWTLNVSRFKTSNDPNYAGEADTIPIPTFIGDIITDFNTLRDFKDLWRKGLLFEQVSNARESQILPRATGRAMMNLGAELGIDGVHPHRFRKTIAEIIINRSERNIDLIRMLFGHKSYKMSLRYIARNPYLVGSVAETMETHFAEDFINIVAAVRKGTYSGVAAERIADVISNQPEAFKGILLRLTIFSYIAYLLESGEPIFIQRTGVGMYCFSGVKYTSERPPPCRVGRTLENGQVFPDPSNCQLECKNVVLLEGAKATIQQNILFYSNLISNSTKGLSRAAERKLVDKIKINEAHFAQLEQSASGVADTKFAAVGGIT